ncbi:MAG: tRNA dihydrouridine(20/20a) synthase DusA [Spirochaetia bacterium]|nr:tRNA dihydrouridine(20/20a) synthase DusA [Spirochaetia bacterium]
MMEWTDRHCRYFHRQLTKGTLLYTEMVLRECAQIAEELAYNEVNLNVGCPSDRVQSGSFGACLMARPSRVADIVRAMRAAVKIPVTVKHRIGIDGRETYDDLRDFVSHLVDAGCDRFIVHARIAILGGLTPAQNRSVPPLRYHDVYRLKEDFPDSIIEINGGIKTLTQAAEQLRFVDGVMIGRAAYENPYILSGADTGMFAIPSPAPSRSDVISAMIPYIRNLEGQGVRPRAVIRHMLGLFHGQPGARRFRRRLSESMHDVGFTVDDFREIADEVIAAGEAAVSLP